MLKRILATIISITIIMSFASISTYAADTVDLCGKMKLATDVPPEDPLKDFVPPSMDFLAEQMVTRSVTRQVAVTEPCDKAWRDTYPSNWMWQAHRCVTNADTMLSSKYGIQYYSVSQKYWTSNHTDYVDLLDEVIDEWGLRDEAKLMVAFSGRDNPDVYGVAYLNTPHCLIFDNGYEYNRETVQHETGHCYGLDHCQEECSSSCTANCVMTESGMGYIDKICSEHNTKWNNAKNKY